MGSDINTLIVTIEFIIFYWLINRRINKSIDEKLKKEKDYLIEECLKKILENGAVETTKLRRDKTKPASS